MRTFQVFVMFAASLMTSFRSWKARHRPYGDVSPLPILFHYLNRITIVGSERCKVGRRNRTEAYG